jgi:PAS domain S-box-containing protein
MPDTLATESEPPTGPLAGGGATGALMRALNWAETPVGPLAAWPQSLRTSVSICLSSRFPMIIFWGPELVQFYNDAYRPILGTKHPAAMGQPARECWPEIWDVVGPMLQGVLQSGEATWSDDQLLLMDRFGFLEETYFTFSYSAIRDETGGVGGVFCAVTETTGRVVGERRLRTLRELSARMAGATTAEQACERAMSALRDNPADLPFAVLYLPDDTAMHAHRVAGMAATDGTINVPATIGFAQDNQEASDPLAEVIRGGRAVAVQDVEQALWPAPLTVRDRPAQPAVLVPMSQPGQERSAGILVAGVSPRQKLDDAYSDFFTLVAGQIAAGVADARAHEEERRRAEALAELDRAKTAFFSNVSHEFRTPLTLLLGPLEEVLGDAAGVPAPARELLTTAHRNGLRLLRLVNTLLDFSRIEAGRAQASFEPTDLAAYTAGLAGVFRAATDRAGLRLLIDCETIKEPVYIDRDMWEKIVLNLISNAFKFTFEGLIEVSLRPEDRHAVLTVRDTGVGIPEDALPHLFERFHRVRGTRARTHEGSGIGLALVQELVRQHGGQITVTSQVGEGTAFRVCVPLGTAHLPADRVQAGHAPATTATGADPFLQEALRWLPDAGAELPLDEARPGDRWESAAAGAEAPKILLVDDSADLRDYLRRLLQGQYQVRVAGDGRAALTLAKTWRPDLIVSDVMMPEMDGFGLLHAVRHDPELRALPVILLSARAGEEAAVEGLAAGADDYLSKPFSARELLARVRTHLTLAGERARAAEERSRLLEGERAARGEAVERAQQLEAVIESIAEPVIVYNARGTIVRTNTAAHTLFGSAIAGDILAGSPEMQHAVGMRALPGTDWPPSEMPARRILAGEVLTGPTAVDMLSRDNQGNDHYLRVVGAPIRDVEGRVIGGVNVIHDLTELHALELAVRMERDRLDQVLDLLPDAVVVCDSTPAYLICNAAARQILGEDVAGLPIQFGGDTLLPGLQILQGDGSLCPAEEMPLSRALLRGESVLGEQLLVRARNGRETPVLASSVPLHGDNGSVTGAVLVFQDISAMKDLERARDEFMASLAHDLKTPLTSIRGFAQLAIRRLKRMDTVEIEALSTIMSRIEMGTSQMVNMMNELMDVMRLRLGAGIVLDLQPVDLVQLVRDVLAGLPDAQGRTLEVQEEAPTIQVVVDRARMARVIANLLSNAFKYTGEGDGILVRVAQSGAWAEIVVRDQGIGISERDLPRIFDRFQRGENVPAGVGGMGIGLSSAYQIVTQHGGSITVESVLGQGSTFTVRIPARGD